MWIMFRSITFRSCFPYRCHSYRKTGQIILDVIGNLEINARLGMKTYFTELSAYSLGRLRMQSIPLSVLNRFNKSFEFIGFLRVFFSYYPI